MKNKISEKDVQENMQDIIVKTEVEFGKPVTYVTVRMKNGFTVRESSTCVNPVNYDEEVGAQICLEKIEDKIWMLLGYQLQESMAKHDNKPKSSDNECDDCEFKNDCQNDENKNSMFDKFMSFCKENLGDNGEIEDDNEDDDNEYVHLSVSMSPKVFKDLLGYMIIS